MIKGDRSLLDSNLVDLEVVDFDVLLEVLGQHLYNGLLAWSQLDRGMVACNLLPSQQ